MAIHTKKLSIPKGQIISVKFLERVKEIYMKEQENINSKKKGGRLNLEIEVDSNEGLREYNSFDEILSEILPEKIDSIEISVYNYSQFKDFMSFSLRIHNKYSFLSKFEIKGKNEEAINRILKKVKDLFQDFKTNYSWLYSLKNFPIYSFSTILAISVGMLIFQILKNIDKISERLITFLISLIVFPIIILFTPLFYSLISWLFPEVSFELRDQISNNKKIIRYILGVVALSLMGNFVWVIVGVIF